VTTIRPDLSPATLAADWQRMKRELRTPSPAWWSDDAPDLDFDEMWNIVTARLRGDTPNRGPDAAPTPDCLPDGTPAPRRGIP
jgi:hypothetical protein